MPLAGTPRLPGASLTSPEERPSRPRPGRVAFRLAVMALLGDYPLALAGTALLGGGMVWALAGLARSNPPAAIAGGLAAGLALVLLVSAGWLNGLDIVALSLPFPALYATSDLRIATAAPVTAAVVFALTLRRGLQPDPLDFGGTPRRSLAGLGITILAAAVVAAYPVVSAREVLNLGILLALLLLATDQLSGRPERVRRLSHTLVTVAAVCGGLALLETLRILPGSFPRSGTAFNRAALGFGQPNALGLFFAIMAPLAIYRRGAARTPGGRALATTAVAVIVLGLVGTFSRGSWLSLLGGSAALLVSGARRRLVRFWIGVAVVAVLVDVVSGGALRDTFRRTLGDWVIEQRFGLMLAGIAMFLAHPLLGVGPGGYARNLDRFGAQIFSLWDYLPTPHNAYIQMAAEAGLLGLVAFVVFMAASWWGVGRRLRLPARIGRTADALDFDRALLWSLTTIALAGMVVWPLSHGTGEAVMLVLAMSFATPGASRSGSDGKP